MGHFENSNMRPASPIVFKLGVPVSVVCVAATYTGVTYANNGGKVQLSSAGVHGLTTSPAVGSSVYLSWTDGIGVVGLKTILSVDSTLAFTVDMPYVVGLGTPTVAKANTEVVLTSISIPPLQKNSVIELSAYLDHTVSANAKSIFSRINGSNATERYPSSTQSFTYLVGNITNLNSTESQAVNAQASPQGGANTTTLRTVETNGVNTFEISAKPTAANEYVKLLSYIVKVFI